jgi:hypothetical protein
MNEKIKSFSGFLNESSSNNLPSLEEFKSFNGFRDLKELFPDMEITGGEKNPIEIEIPGNYNMRFTKMGIIYYGGYIVGKFEKIDDKKLEFVKEYSISKALDLSLPSLEAIINGKTPISNKILKKDWEKYTDDKRSRRFRIFKKGVLERIKDLSKTIKYYQNHPLDKSYELVPELKKIVEDEFKKSPIKETKEGELTLEQKNYLKNLIHRNPRSSYGLEFAGKPKYKLNKETGLVDVYGDFKQKYDGSVINGNKNFMGVKFGKIYGTFSVYSEVTLPEKNLSGFPIEVVNSFHLYDNGSIQSLKGLPKIIGGDITVRETSVRDFSPLNDIDLNNKSINLGFNEGLKSLNQIKFPPKIEHLNVSGCPIKNLEGSPDEVKRFNLDQTEIEDLKGSLKKSNYISLSSRNLKDISGISKIDSLNTFQFNSDYSNSRYIGMKLPPDGKEIERLIDVLGSEHYSNKDKELLLTSGILNDYIYKYFEDNPLKIHILDGSPEIKKQIMDKTGIPDLSRLGKLIDKGWL